MYFRMKKDRIVRKNAQCSGRNSVAFVRFSGDAATVFLAIFTLDC